MVRPSLRNPSQAVFSEAALTGKERDTESGLDYFGARYYASSMGRWISPDWAAKAEPVPYAKLDNPQSLNLYSYVLNNPLSKANPDGHCVEDFCIVEGAAVVAFAESPAGQQLEAEAEEVAERYSGQIEAGLSRAGSWAGAQLAKTGNFLEEQAQNFSGTPKNTERILQGEANGANYRVPDLMVKVGEKTAAIGEVKIPLSLGTASN
ncbi:RHS repeat-associated core domain-containing protein [Granulicella mallensis]|uniref:RHS repeat-associated protein n=1 Tax=Granulicella mallensis TaxID=940614 RepID=A0A7W8EAM3_9BACT|nr:RHS repeat-associated core domain-containing protein [Granulicella mallensis]MBB5064654.1 RHS repeat-associated protein [Granulicella mallensis]